MPDDGVGDHFRHVVDRIDLFVVHARSCLLRELPPPPQLWPELPTGMAICSAAAVQSTTRARGFTGSQQACNMHHASQRSDHPADPRPDAPISATVDLLPE